MNRALSAVFVNKKPTQPASKKTAQSAPMTHEESYIAHMRVNSPAYHRAMQHIANNHPGVITGGMQSGYASLGTDMVSFFENGDSDE